MGEQAIRTEGHMQLRAMRQDEKGVVAELVFHSTNAWYVGAGKGAIFRNGAESCRLFPDVYEDLDPGCCVVAEDEGTGRVAGSCFYHPRETHISLGIMNVHPDFFGQGVAGKLLRFVTNLADAQAKPLRLVSSVMNLDSYSLYTRAGFTPRAVFQDILFSVPPTGLSAGRTRPATTSDVPAMVELEERVSGIRREKDYRYFIENPRGIWHVSVLENEGGGLQGFLCSVNHPASNMLGPGVMASDAAAVELIRAELNVHKGRSPVFLVPADRGELVRRVYEMGGRNCEIHFAQCRGTYPRAQGVVMPTFMPETG
jgi:GNAT superfamily N-acetyltransferase